ncbi:MAG: DUF3793 family protein [Peptostreptococcaceae bacterium]|nr:DUF3793 family protein [Peptostreptococcaceae bacterium]
MMLEEFERMLAYHCAPTLSGIKSGNIFSIRHQDRTEIREIADTYNTKLRRFGIYIELLCLCENRAVVYAYRRSALLAELSEEKMRRFLASKGYEVQQDIESLLVRLKARMNSKEDFPHEIGAFLGYPLEDIVDFIRCRGKDFKLNGYWKVYHDVRSKKALFEAFSKSRNRFCQELSLGRNLQELVYAA